MEYERECRVCRGGEEQDRPLFAPCLCSGSIKFCHQDCLELWLDHSRKTSCELCKTTYVFEPKYDPRMPPTISSWEIAIESVKMSTINAFPYLSKWGIAAFCWLVIVPYCTAFFYRFLIDMDDALGRLNLDSVIPDVISGIVLIGASLILFLVMVRLTMVAITFMKTILDVLL